MFLKSFYSPSFLEQIGILGVLFCFFKKIKMTVDFGLGNLASTNGWCNQLLNKLDSVGNKQIVTFFLSVIP